MGPLLLMSGLFLLPVTELSSLRKLGPVPTTGVAKFRGLGRVLLSPAAAKVPIRIEAARAWQEFVVEKPRR